MDNKRYIKNLKLKHVVPSSSSLATKNIVIFLHKKQQKQIQDKAS